MFSRRLKSLLIFAAAAFFLISNVSFAGGIKTYFKDRFFDLADLMRIQVKIPNKMYSISVNARCTSLAQAGGGYFSGHNFGLDRRGAGLWKENKIDGGISLLYFTDIKNQMSFGNAFTDIDSDWSQFSPRGIVRNLPYWDDGRNQPLSIGVEAQFFFLPGLDIGFYPEELVDFVTGIFGMDLKEDDMGFVQKIVECQMPTEDELKEDDITKIIQDKKLAVKESSSLAASEGASLPKAEKAPEDLKKSGAESLKKSAAPAHAPAKANKSAIKKGILPDSLTDGEIKSLDTKKDSSTVPAIGPPKDAVAPAEEKK